MRQCAFFPARITIIQRLGLFTNTLNVNHRYLHDQIKNNKSILFVSGMLCDIVITHLPTIIRNKKGRFKLANGMIWWMKNNMPVRKTRHHPFSISSHHLDPTKAEICFWLTILRLIPSSKITYFCRKAIEKGHS